MSEGYGARELGFYSIGGWGWVLLVWLCYVVVLVTAAVTILFIFHYVNLESNGYYLYPQYMQQNI